MSCKDGGKMWLEIVSPNILVSVYCETDLGADILELN